MPRRGENIYKRKDGRWEGRVKVGTKTDGTLKYKSVYGKTYNGVKQKMNDIMTDTSLLNSSSSKTVKSLFEEWFSSVKLTVKPSTYSNYKMKAEKHILPEFGELRYDKLEVNMLNSFIEKKIQAGLSEKYVSDIMIVFKSMARYVNRVYGIKNIVKDAAVPKSDKNEIAVLTDEQQTILYRQLLKNTDSTDLCILLSLYTGIRVGEVCCLTWSDIDFDNHTVSISKTVQRMQETDSASTKIIIGTPKSKSSARIIPIPYFLEEILKEHRKSDGEYILSGCSKVTEPRTLQRRFKKILKKAGLPDIHYHSLRHMFATNCIKKGFDVRTLSEILGHSSVETTLNRYVHSSMNRKIECMNMLTPAV